ncbi:MAG: YesL family protein [Chloroflexi bacterium]|nr:YesL family protein [Chloroflexota bacterium]
MKNVFGVFWNGIKIFWDELFVLVLMNLLTAILLVPVVTFPPALAGLWNVANLLSRGESIEWRDYFNGFKRYFWKSWAFTFINLVVFLLLYVNFTFYAPEVPPFNLRPEISLWVRMFVIVIGALWLCLQMYPMAMLMEQDEQKILLALRNSAILLFANPGFSLVLALLLLLLAAASTLLPALWAMITLALFAVICAGAVQHLLIPHRERLAVQTEADGDEETSEYDVEE